MTGSAPRKGAAAGHPGWAAALELGVLAYDVDHVGGVTNTLARLVGVAAHGYVRAMQTWSTLPCTGASRRRWLGERTRTPPDRTILGACWSHAGGRARELCTLHVSARRREDRGWRTIAPWVMRGERRTARYAGRLFIVGSWFGVRTEPSFHGDESTRDGPSHLSVAAAWWPPELMGSAVASRRYVGRLA